MTQNGSLVHIRDIPSVRFFEYHTCRKLILILACVSLILLSYEIFNLKYTVINANDYLGLTSHLSIIYWIGLGLIVFCSIILFFDKDLKSKFDCLFILAILGLQLFGPGVFSTENALMPWSYYPLSEVNVVLNSHHIKISDPYPLISYRAWPGFVITSTIISIVSTIELKDMAKYMPLFWLAVFIFITFSIGLKLKLDVNQSFFLTSLSVTSFIVPQYYYCPQSYAYLLYLITFYFLITYRGTTNDKLILIILISALLIWHLLSPIIIILGMISLSILKKKLMFLALTIILFIAWYTYISTHIFAFGVERLLDLSETFGGFFVFSSIKFVPLTDAKRLLNYIRLTYLILFFLLTISGIFCLFLRNKVDRDIYSISCIAWLTSFVAILPIKYGPEGLERIYLFGLIPAMYIIIKNIKHKNILVTFFLIFTFLHIPSHYGDACYLITQTGELKGSEFFSNNFEFENPFYYDFHPYVRFFNPATVTKRNLYFMADKIPDSSLLNQSHSILYGEQSKNRMLFFFGENHIYLWLEENIKYINKNYNNGKFYIYVKPYGLTTYIS